jgi:hypothetical protein
MSSSKLPNGHEITLDIVHHPGASAVVPFTGDGEVALIRQYRHAAGGTISRCRRASSMQASLPSSAPCASSREAGLQRCATRSD